MCHETPKTGQGRDTTTFQAEFPPQTFRGLDRSPPEALQVAHRSRLDHRHEL
jgi:hypothetical protein